MTSYRQLKQQIAQLEKKAALVKRQELKKVIDSIREQIAEYGLTAEDLGFGSTVKKTRASRSEKPAPKRTLKAKYRDPVSGRTWNGHGKRPLWFIAAQEKGKAEDLLIDKQSEGKSAPAAKAVRRRRAKPAKAAAPKTRGGARKPAKKAAAPAPKKRRATPKAAAAPKKTRRKAPAQPQVEAAPAPAPEVAAA